MKYSSKRQHLLFVLTYIHFNYFFSSSTKENFVKIARISSYMDFNLGEGSLTDPDILIIYNLFHPRHLAFMALFTANIGAAGVQHGKVYTKDELLVILTSKNLADWDFAIQTVYRKGTEVYEILFPHGHAPFLHGTIDERIAAILVLTTAMEDYSLLDAERLIIEAFYTR